MKCKKKTPKYQLAGIANALGKVPTDLKLGDLKNFQVKAPNNTALDTTKDVMQQQGIGHIFDYLGSKFEDSTRTSPIMDIVNAGVTGITAIGKQVNNLKAAKKEQQQYLDSIRPVAYENNERYGLNTNPVFTKYGGGKYQVGGNIGELVTDVPKDFNFLREDPNGLKIYNKKSSVSLPEAKSSATQGSPEYEKFLQDQLSKGVSIEELINKKYISKDNAANYSKYYKPVEQFVHTAPQKNQDPYANWSGRKQPIHFDNKTVGEIWYPTSETTNSNTQGNLNTSQQPAIFRFRNDWGFTGEEIPVDAPEIQKYLGTSQAFTSKENYESLLNAAKQRMIKLQTGGLVKSPTTNKDLADIEAEKGEVIQHTDGDFSIVDPNGATHEEGGEYIPDVHRVLENTSDLRNDKNSKYLKMSPQEVKETTGVDVSKPISHSKAMAKATQKYDDQRSKIVDKISLAAKGKKNLDKYAENATKLNLDTFASIPTNEQIFENLFNHQETVKAVYGIENANKAQYGISTYKGDASFKGNASKYSDTDWASLASKLGFKGKGNKEFQQFLYNNPILKPVIDQLHKQFGDPKGGTWFDGRLGHRWDKVMDYYKSQTPAKNNTFTDEDLPVEQVNKKDLQDLDTSIQNTADLKTQPKSKFNEPLRWFDVASPVSTYLSAIERIPEKYNPVEFSQLKYKLQDPTATLQQNQADFNASVAAVQGTGENNSGVQLANIANLAAKKYAVNNQILGQYENANNQIKNNEITYNTQVRDKQSVANQQARESFEEKVLTSKAKQQEQKLTAMDALYKTIAENRALNRNGNLIMKFSNAFDQYGNYNGYQTKFQVNPSLGVNPTTSNQPAGGIQNLVPGKTYYNRKTGKVLKFDGNNLVELK